MRFFVVCPGGLETVLATELRQIAERPEVKAQGVWVIDPTPTSPTGGVGLAGPLSAAMALNLHSRIASRVLLQMAESTYRQEDDLYRLAHGLAWEEWFTHKQTLRVDVTAHRSPLKSLNFATLKIKDAIVDRLREVSGDRPSIDTAFPDVRVQAHLTATHVSIYLDTSGEALFKRGWRDEKGDAPLKENLAAGILALTGWQPKQPLFDPMCGSGTFLIEAAQIAMGVPSGAIRAGLYDEAGKETTPTRLAYRPLVTSVHGFGFLRLKPYAVGAEQKKWQALKDAVLAEILERRKAFPDAQSLGISGSDINEKLVSMTKSNWQRAQLPGLPVVRQVDALAAKQIDSIDRSHLPHWILQRLKKQGQSVESGSAGQEALEFIANQVEGNLIAAHQEIQKLGLLYPQGALTEAQIRESILKVARYDVFQLTESILAGDLARLNRMLDGLKGEGEPLPLILWSVTEELRILSKLQAASQRGESVQQLMRVNRIWGNKEKLYPGALRRVNPIKLRRAMQVAAGLDRQAKGLSAADLPADPWDGLRLVGSLLR